MVKFQRLIIMAVILLGFNFKVHAELVVEPNGRMRVPTGGFNQNGVRTWRYLDNGRGGMGGNMFYHEIGSKSLAVREASTGLRSASTVPVTIESRVSKSTVFRNLLARARVGGKYVAQRAAGRLGAGLLGGPAGWAITAAITAYDLASPIAASEGYYYDDKYQDFVKPKTYVYCVATSGLCTDQRVEETVMNPKAVYADMGPNPSDAEINKKLCSQLDVQHFGFEYPDRFSKKDAKFNARKDTCEVEFNVLKEVGFLQPGKTTTSETRVMERVPKVKEPIPQSVFDKAVQPSADASPSKYVNATANQDGSVPGESQGNPTVPNGTVVTLGPATGQDGRPFQMSISFMISANGNTSATVTTTPRPDLTPGSPAAPKTNPVPTPGSGNPGADGKPGEDDKPKEEDKPKDGGLLCEVFPNILACDKQPEAGEEPDLTLPEEVINVEFEKSSAFQESAECPAPVTFNVTVLGASKTFAFSFEHACEIASRLRYMLVALAWVVAAFFCIRAVSREV